MQSLEEVEFLTPPLQLVTEEDRRRHHAQQRWLIIAECNERMMEQWP
jgi:hypothetical protein